MLIACSEPPVSRPLDITVQQPATVHPPKPARPVLEREQWSQCGDKLCMSVEEGKAVIRNKIKLSRYIGKLENIVNYYRKVGSPPALVKVEKEEKK